MVSGSHPRRFARVLRPLRLILPLRWRWALKSWILEHERRLPLVTRLLRWFIAGAAPPGAAEDADLPPTTSDDWRENSPHAGPLISVVVEAREQSPALVETLESLARQTFRDFEVLWLGVRVPDHGDSRIRHVEVSNGGRAAVLTHALQEARGRYACILATGDRLHPTHLEKHLVALESRAFDLAHSGAPTSGTARALDVETLSQRDTLGPGAVFRREAWQRVGGFRSDVPEALLLRRFWADLAAAGCLDVRLPEALAESARQVASDGPLPGPRVDLAKAGEAQSLRRRTLSHDPFLNLGQERHLPPAHGVRRCLFAVESVTYSGAPRVLLNLIEGLLPDCSWEFLVLKTEPLEWTRAGDMTGHFEAGGALCYQIHPTVPREFRRDFLIHLCRAHRIDALLINGCRMAYESLAALREALPGIRVISQLHTAGPLGHEGISVAQDRFIDVHVPIQSRIAESLARQGIAASKIRLIHNGIDMESAFNPSLCPPRADDGAPTLLFPARLHPGKRPLDFVRLVGDLRRDLPRVRGLMVGDGEMVGDVERAIDRRGLRGVVERLDPVTEMAPIYARADLTVITSVVEGLPLTIPESLAMGVPVLTTDVGDVRAAVRDGETGFVVPVGDHRALLDRARRLLGDADLLRRFREAARPSVVERFDRRRMAREYLALLDELVPRSDPS